MTPIDGCLEGSLPCDGGSRSPGQKPESVLKSRFDLFRREDRDPRGRELDRERNAVETPTDASDGVGGVDRVT